MIMLQDLIWQELLIKQDFTTLGAAQLSQDVDAVEQFSLGTADIGMLRLRQGILLLNLPIVPEDLTIVGLMEAASAIYGVTMEELGISQLISVDFKPKNAPARQELPAQTLPESEPQLEAVAVGVASNPSERESSSTVAEEESKILSESGSVDSNSGSQS